MDRTVKPTLAHLYNRVRKIKMKVEEADNSAASLVRLAVDSEDPRDQSSALKIIHGSIRLSTPDNNMKALFRAIRHYGLDIDDISIKRSILDVIRGAPDPVKVEAIRTLGYSAKMGLDILMNEYDMTKDGDMKKLMKSEIDKFIDSGVTSRQSTYIFK